MFLRLFVKSIGWRILAITITTGIALCVLDDATVALSIGIADTVLKICAYYGYDLFWQKVINKPHDAAVIWFTGLSGSGKTTVANHLLAGLRARGQPAMILDGDQIRSIFPKTGFDRFSREAHIEQTARMAALLESQGITVLVSLISPYKKTREYARSISKRFIEVYMADDLSVCQERDVKGLYAKVAKGEIKNFTGVDDPYEAPESPELRFEAKDYTIAQIVKHIIRRYKDETSRS